MMHAQHIGKYRRSFGDQVALAFDYKTRVNDTEAVVAVVKATYHLLLQHVTCQIRMEIENASLPFAQR